MTSFQGSLGGGSPLSPPFSGSLYRAGSSPSLNQTSSFSDRLSMEDRIRHSLRVSSHSHSLHSHSHSPHSHTYHTPSHSHLCYVGICSAFCGFVCVPSNPISLLLPNVTVLTPSLTSPPLCTLTTHTVKSYWHHCVTFDLQQTVLIRPIIIAVPIIIC